MQLCILHLDNAYDHSSSFVNMCNEFQAQHIYAGKYGRKLRLWGKHKDFLAWRSFLAEQIKAKLHGPFVFFTGSGDFHNITPSLIECVTRDSQAISLTVIHIDNHPDWVKCQKGVHCGSWVNETLKNPVVSKVITLGVCSKDLRLPEWKGANLDLISQGVLEVYPYDRDASYVRKTYHENKSFKQKDRFLNWKTIAGTGEENFIHFLLSRIKTENIYLTIDKDVLGSAHAVANWDQGRMSLSYLKNIITHLSKDHKIIGVDIVGDYSKPAFSGCFGTRLLKYFEIWIDHAHKPPSVKTANHINNVTNQEILKTLLEVFS